VFNAPEVFGTSTFLLSGTVGLDLQGSGNVHAPQCTGEILVSDFAYDTLQFGDYKLRLKVDDDSLQLSLTSEWEDLVFDGGAVLNGDFPFAAHLDLQHFKLDRFVTPATGYVTARVSGDGELAHLTEAVCTVQIDTFLLLFEQKPIQNVGAMIVQLQDRTISVQSCELSVAGQRASIQGRVPLDFESSAMDFSVSSSLVQLSDISYLLPTDPAISGDLRLDLRVQGKPRALDINGQLALTNGRYETSDLRIDSVNSLLGFKNGVITIERLSGMINRGQFDINGFADLSRGLLDTFSVFIAVDHFDYANKNFGNLLCSADLRISACRDSVRIGGEVLIDDAVYDKPVSLQDVVGLLTKANRPPPQQSEFSKRTYCDIGIVVPDSVRIANNVANVSVKADLQLKGYLARLNAYGTIAAIGDGSIQYLGKKFRITSAVIQFDDPYKIDPVIDLMATTTIAAADGDYEIFLSLDGTVTTWHLELNSNPPLPEQDIVSLILIGQLRPGAAGGMMKELNLKGKVKDYALDMIRHNIERTTAGVLGLDEFTITGDLSDPTTMRIGIEKSIARGFKIHYSTGVESWELYQVGASYDLTDKLSIFTMYDQENRNTSVDLDFHIKIK
jgi:translocation and assembly module TamB